MLDPRVVVYVSLSLVFILVSFLIFREIARFKDRKIVLENKILKLEPGSVYRVKFKPHFWESLRGWEIEPDLEQTVTAVMATKYNGDIDITVNVHVGNMIVYTAFLKNVKEFNAISNEELRESNEELKESDDDDRFDE